MTFEHENRKIDSCGRINIPRHLRDKFGMAEGTFVEFYSCEKDGKKYLCIKLKDDEEE